MSLFARYRFLPRQIVSEIGRTNCFDVLVVEWSNFRLEVGSHIPTILYSNTFGNAATARG